MNDFTAPSPQNINLNTLDDEQIKKIIADGYKLLDQRKREKEKKVKEQIKTMAQEAGIKVSFSESTTRKRAKAS